MGPGKRPEITLSSEQYPQPIRVDLHDLQPRSEEQGCGEAVVRRVAASIYRETGKKGGFYGRVHSTCQPGKGISSSAAEVFGQEFARGITMEMVFGSIGETSTRKHMIHSAVSVRWESCLYTVFVY